MTSSLYQPRLAELKIYRVHVVSVSVNSRVVGHSEAILKTGTPMGDWIGPVKSPSRHVGFAAEVKLRSERMSVI